MLPVRARASFSYLRRHPWQLALSVLGIAIGVAVIIAVDIANSSARKAFLLSMDTVAGAATHQVIGGPRGVPETVYTSLRVQLGIDAIAPVVEGDIRVQEERLTLLGIDVFAESGVRSFTEVPGDDEGRVRRFLTEPGSVTMSTKTAELLGLEVGDEFIVEAGGRRFNAGVLALFDSGPGAADRLLTVDIATAQSWLDQVGYLSRIDVRLDSDIERQTLQSGLPVGTVLLDAAGRTRTTLDLSAAFMTNLTAMSLLALLIGVFLIYNSVSFSVLQRRNLVATLRALGMTRREIFAQIMAEAALLGVIAGAAGLAIGILLGEQLLALVSRSINDLYFRVSVTDISVSSLTLGKGMAAGLLTALLAAAIPALEAAGVRPSVAFRRSSLEQAANRSLPRLALAGVSVILVATLVLLLSGRSLVAGLTAVFMLIAGFALLIPMGVRVMTEGTSRYLVASGRTTIRLAVGGVGASLSRTGVAIVALSVAVSATIGVSVMVDSFRGSVSKWLGQALQADVYVAGVRSNIDSETLAQIRERPDIVAVSTSRSARIEDENGIRQLLAVDMAPGGYAGTDIIDGEPSMVWERWDSVDGLLVSEPFAWMNQVARGDGIELRTDAGIVSFEVLGVYQSYDVSASGLMISRRVYDRHFDDDAIDGLGLYLAQGADPAAVAAELNRLGDGRLSATSTQAIRELSMRVFDRTFVITDVLYWLALGVALVGILSSMLALQLEKDREQGTLRALGMTPGQVGRLVTTQTGVIGLLSGIASIPLGLVMAWVLIEVINRRAFGWQIDVAVSPSIVGGAVVFSVLAAVLAGLYPAWRASRIRPAIAMREE